MAKKRATGKTKQRQPNILFSLVAAGFIVLSIININYIFYGDENIFSYYTHKQQNIELREVVRELGAENKKLRGRIDDLRSSPDAIEGEVRYDLNLVKPGEVLYFDDEESGDGESGDAEDREDKN